MADIVLVEDEQVLRRTLEKTLTRFGHELRAFESAEDGLKAIEEAAPDLVITDNRLGGMSGTELLRHIKKKFPDVNVVMMTAYGSIEDAVGAMREGASDYLRKPIDLHELGMVVDRCLSGAGTRRELAYYRNRDLTDIADGGIIGASAPIAEVRETVKRLAGLQKKGGGPTILLLGETGTGKGLFARAIHRASPRRDAPFIEVNCTAIPENLLEAEIMGYERGAFTDAQSSKIGLVEAAEGGTVFFDEIGRMSQALQAKLLKVIEDKTVRRLGSTRDRKIDCTIITASHRDLAVEVSEGRFLPDLYHRINVISLMLPPLRERGADIELLADFFLDLHTSEYGVPKPALSDKARNALLSYAWPGNIRELSHTIERAIVMGTTGTINTSALRLPVADPNQAVPGRISGGTLTVDFNGGPIRLEEVEVSLIRQAMEFADGNQVQAARLLGMSRDTLRYRLAKHQLR